MRTKETAWNDISEGVKSFEKGQSNSKRHDDITDISQVSLALIQWFKSQDIDPGVGGASMSLLLGILAGQMSSCTMDLLIGLSIVEHSIKCNATAELKRKNDGKK